MLDATATTDEPLSAERSGAFDTAPEEESSGVSEAEPPPAPSPPLLEQELAWLERLLAYRLERFLAAASGQDAQPAPTTDSGPPSPPSFEGLDDLYAHWLEAYQFGVVERLALILALATHLRPRLFDVLLVKNATYDRRFTELGGIQTSQGDILPTGETLAFLLAGEELDGRLLVWHLFDPRHVFARHDLLGLHTDHPAVEKGYALRGPLRLAEDTLSLLASGVVRPPSFGAAFPARPVTTQMEWDDLVLHPSTRQQLAEILAWCRHGDTLRDAWGLGPKLRPGYRCLFYGPPGTGKTLSAGLLGQSTGRDVYAVDLSQVVSKYIGETEKNLGRVFDRAQSKGWILFFDEADALFGKRTETKDSHDRHANQEVAYLLQRIETFDGIVILASNFRDNLDAAFARRFESMVHFPLPRPRERLELWRRALPDASRFGDGVDLESLAKEHALSGASIVSVVRFAALRALEDGREKLSPEDVRLGIRRELEKEGKVVG